MKRKHAKYAATWLAFSWSLYIILIMMFSGTAYARSSSEIRTDISSVESQIQNIQSQLSDTNLKISESASTFSEKKSLYENSLKFLASKKEEVDIASMNYDNSSIPNATFSSSVIKAEVYNNYGYGNRPPLPGLDRLISTQNVEDINFQWGGGPVLNTLYDRVAVKFTGTITTTEDKIISFYAPGDDGVKVYIDNALIIDDWYDKGGGGSMSQSIFFKAGEPKTFTLWFYENGGGANVWLYWNYNGYYQIVPKTAFSVPAITYSKDPALLEILNIKQAEYESIQNDVNSYKNQMDEAQGTLDALYLVKQDYENQLIDLNNRLDVLNKELEQAIIDESTPPWYSNEVYENQDMTISLNDGLVFSSIKAWYGSPTDKSCGADVSQQVSDYFKDKQSATINANNGVFGDPCGGVVKVLRVSYETKEVPIITPTPEVSPEPSPVVTPTPEPSPLPSPEPSVEPSPSPEITPTPEPSIEPTPILTPEPSSNPVSTPTPIEDPIPVETPVVEPIQQPVDNPTPVETPSSTPIEQTVQEQLEEQMSNPIPEISAAAIGESAKQAVAATAKFVKDLFTNPAAAGKALMAIGSSMSEEERAAARPVVIATVVVNIISSSVTGMTIRGVKF